MMSNDLRSLVKHRLGQARTALDDAKFLLDGGRSPQGIINRCYYAMFYAVLALLQTIGEVPGKHSGAISLFDKEFVGKNIFPRELSKDLHKAFDLRQVSDYRAAEEPTREKAAALWDKAAHFVDVVEASITTDK